MINLIKVGNTYNIPIHDYEVDEQNEIEQIDNCPVGSIVTVLSTGKQYKLRSSGQWAEIIKPSGGGGSGNEMYLSTLELGLGNPITLEGAPDWAYVYDISLHQTEISALYDEKAELRIHTSTYHDDESIQLVRGDDVWTKNCTIGAQGIIWDNPDEDCFAIVENAGIFVSNIDLSQKSIVVEKLNRLPYVNSDDNGKALAVQNGAWRAVISPVAPFVVHMTVDVMAKTAATTDGTTIQQIYQAAQTNPFIFAEFQLGTSTTRAPLISYGYDDSDNTTNAMFSGVGAAGAKGIVIDGEYDGTDDTWTLTIEV